MAYVRKTVDTFEIQGFYYGEWEMLTTETNKKDAFRALKEYRENQPGTSYKVKKVRVKKSIDKV